HTATELLGTSEETAKAALISGYSQILHKSVDFQITLSSFNRKQKAPTSFTVTIVHSSPIDGVHTTVKVEANSENADLPPTKKARIDEIIETEVHEDEA
ncbi:hypothetical protein MKX01_040302, partial [Papaver californicum]